MTPTLLAIDPGESTGWSTWLFEEDKPLMRVDYGLVPGGLDGWVLWMEGHLGLLRPDIVVCEKFELDGRTMYPNLTPKLIEWSLVPVCRALGLPEPIWQTTDYKALCSDETLKLNGFWFTPAQARSDPAINHKDARDVNDSQIHALAWAFSNGHQPSLQAFIPNE